MNEPSEDLTQDEEIAAPLSVVDKPKSEFTRPPYEFKGNELFAFTEGYKTIFNQVRDGEDAGLYTWEAFTFLLRKKTENESEPDHRKAMIKLAWRVEEFRYALTVWKDEIGPFTTADTAEMQRIFNETMKAIADSEVEVIPDRKRTSQKKTQPLKKHSSSMSSEGS